MKKSAVIVLFLAAALNIAGAQEKKQIVKTGLNFGPLPVVAFDADKGLQLGALLNIYNFGDGSNYPNYNSKWYFEASFFTKGSQLYQLMYDNKELIPGVRWSSAIVAQVEKAMDFYGFNGYETNYSYESVKAGETGDSFIYTPFYRMSRTSVLAKTDFTGHITDHLFWEAGYHASYFKTGAIDRANINKGKSEQQMFPDNLLTLYEIYKLYDIISEDEADGGFSSEVRLGLVYDTRDKEGAPTRGIWAEAHLSAAPKWLGTKNPYYRYSATWRHYVPIVKHDKLTFAYRLNYEGTIGSNAPFYVLPYITVMGENSDRDGMGGYRTVRGMLRDRVVGLDMFSYNAELRWRFVGFRLFNQNMAFGLNLFSDGAVVTRKRDLSMADGYFKNGGESRNFLPIRVSIRSKESLHVTVGAGLRFIMNENFIVAFEYGKPLSSFNKNSAHYMQDGKDAFYINIGYLF